MPTLFLHFFLFVITTTVTNLIPAVHSNCIEAQKQSLLHFKQSLEFDSSKSSKLITWNSSTECCSWLGVTFSTNGSVVGLDISSESISCSIDNSSSLFQLQRLQSLNLANNDFKSSSIPSAIGKLTKLRYLNLRGAFFSGTIPSSVVSLPKLEILTLSHNRFSGQVPEFSTTSSPLLGTLDLENNNLEGPIPTSIFNLQGLLNLNLSSNNFSSFPFNGPRLPRNLSSVDLSHNSMLFDYNGSNSSFLQIRHLVLASNKLRAFPDFLRNQSILYYLDLSNNQIQGKIPNWILSLKSLNSLDLSGNSLASLEAPLPNSTSALSSLDLRSNKLQGIHSSYSFLQLGHLGLASNKLTTFPDFLRNQSYLTYLDISDNQIQGQIPNWIWSFKLQELNLSCNSLESLEAPLHNSTYVLSKVDLHSNQLQGHFPFFLNSRYLDYSRNNFSSSIPSDIGDFISNVYYLSLSSNNFHGAIPKSICNASCIVLDLSNNSLSGNIPQCLTQSHQLSVIDLKRNNLSGTIPDNFPNICGLQTLDLSNNQIQGKFPKSLVNCSKLEVSNIGNNNIADTFPCFLMSLSTLRVLVLRSNMFYGSIGCPKTNGTWPVLQIIDLSHNNFSGDMPGRLSLTWQAMVSNKDDSPTNLGFSSVVSNKDDSPINLGPSHQLSPHVQCNKEATNKACYSYSGISRSIRETYTDFYYRDTITTIIKGSELDVVKILTIFTLIDYSYNKFNGSIPEEIGELKSLYALNLSGNAFTGKIPSSFGKMRQLESLDLSKNHLSGQIPPEFANLNFLSHLNVSYNQLTGRIPTNTQFSTFPSTSFEGNKGLWGPPLTSDTAIVLPPPKFNGSSSNPNSGDEIDWNVISAEIGFTCGFGIAVGSLLFCKRWRKWYYRAMFNILFKIFPQLEHRFGNHRRHVYINQRYWRR
ncbi:receptor-like protein 19 [Rosa rugosa]|uniref:receptor-like protein 19 n=1 Tax=Rosa rugosa TaxID=74645 RepID=UPI002B409314|nr:receptor-like protein 19 [Rosa rugosa]